MTATSRDKIMKSALKEFAAKGYAGARIEAIAKRAGINKAMVFYYYSCKRDLYKIILQHALSKLFSEILGILTPRLTAAFFFESMPRIYINFFSRYPDLIKIIGFDLLQSPGSITSAVSEIAHGSGVKVPKPILWSLIRKWHKEGTISEADPAQVMMNIISLSVFSFIGLPMIEKISGEKIPISEPFYQKRIQSVVNVLKKGMLK